ncbi:phage portal protein, partial [Sporosarcina sp. NCCP-2378]|uniref:phage portal protein n=2 Tax=unclassified Sporosarcina TaxID=2647733 RepID=UPI002232596B
TAYQLKFILVANALLNGQSYAEIVRSPRGVPIAIYHLNNSKVKYRQDETTGFQLIYEYQEKAGTLRRIPKENILHMKFFSLDGIEGKSPLLSLEEDLTTQRNSKKFLSNFFKNGTQSGGLLKYKGGKLAKEAREKLRDEWQNANAGSDKAHKVLVLDETMEYEPIEVDTEILKLINTSVHNT